MIEKTDDFSRADERFADWEYIVAERCAPKPRRMRDRIRASQITRKGG